MADSLTLSSAVMNARTLCVGALGAGVAHLLSLPAAVLIGPALAVSAAAAAGMRLGISDGLRNTCFVVLGIGIGAGFDPQAGAALLRWPLAFAVLGVALVLTLWLSRAILEGGFGFDRRSAVLAAAPGHLSFVLGLASDLNCDPARVAVVQSVRLLALTITVPFIALAMGYRIGPAALSKGAPMGLVALALLAVAAIVAGRGLTGIGSPAPLLLGAMAVSALAHVTSIATGSVPQQIMIPGFLVLGTLIGTRFAGLTRDQIMQSLGAGLVMTAVAATVTSLAALPVAMALGMPAPHVMAAFAPGGLETMIALSAAMGASPGFVAACHIVRLAILSAVIPLAVARRKPG